MFEITKSIRFYAAHRNAEIGGKCASLHGHTYVVTAKVESWLNEQTGVSVLFEEVEQPLRHIYDLLDHSTMLNKLDPLAEVLHAFGGQKLAILDFPTSAECLAAWIANCLETHSQGKNWTVVSVQVQETETSSAIYSPRK